MKFFDNELNFTKRTAFTLAEVMIVLTVIGVLAAILLPTAMHNLSNRDVMKFRKANNVLLTAISGLVNSDEYYFDGDLGIKTDGTPIDGTHSGDETYFCKTLADVINHKNADCKELGYFEEDHRFVNLCGGWINNNYCTVDTDYESQNGAWWLDTFCRTRGIVKNVNEQIILPDGTVIYENHPDITFGYTVGGKRIFADAGAMMSPLAFDVSPVIYKVLCIDIDGIAKNGDVDNCVNECPFGYGVRADGRVVPGERAKEWLEKELN